MVTDAQLAAILKCPLPRAEAWGTALRAAMQKYGISTPRRVAHFLAQIGHESAGLHRVAENLNYSARRLLEVFPRHFTAESARRCANQPEAIANIVYARRMGNGQPASGDGWRYRGRSPIQLTGRHNYAHMQQLTGLPLLAQPELAEGIEAGAQIAAAWWRDNGLNALADAGDVLAVSRRINLGTTRTSRMPHGYADRAQRTRAAQQILEAR